MLIGPPGSGKSTWAQTYIDFVDSKAVIVSRDGFRKMFKGDYRVDQDSEKLITTAVNSVVTEALKKHDVILDACHCKMSYIKEVIDTFGKIADIDYRLMENLTLEELINRNTVRTAEKQVPVDVIKRFKDGFNHIISNTNEIDMLITLGSEKKVESVQAPEYDTSKPDCIIVDVDGTVAHMGDRRGPFEWDKVDLDYPDEVIIGIIEDLYFHALHSGDYLEVIFVSGREGTETCIKKTLEWLGKHVMISDFSLLVRKEKDYRKDSIVKKEIYENSIAPYYNVRFVLDDRQQVVDMWRSLGLKCLQVAEGNF